jgi:hypothetical protein
MCRVHRRCFVKDYFVAITLWSVETMNTMDEFCYCISMTFVLVKPRRLFLEFIFKAERFMSWFVTLICVPNPISKIYEQRSDCVSCCVVHVLIHPLLYKLQTLHNCVCVHACVRACVGKWLAAYVPNGTTGEEINGERERVCVYVLYLTVFIAVHVANYVHCVCLWVRKCVGACETCIAQVVMLE